MSFEKNVFINCPFDDKYKPVLKSIIFSVICCGFNPQLSENKDSSENRLESIQNLIEKSKFSIHDLSRMVSNKKGELARLNMAFELGMDIGCKRYKGGEHINKRCLILDSEQYRYKRSLSDISGNDISYHNNSPERVTGQIRHWLRKHQNDNLPTSSNIWTLYNQFEGNLEALVIDNTISKADVDDMPWTEYFNYIKVFLIGKGIL